MWDLTLNRSKLPLPLLSSAPSKYVCVTQKLGQIRYIPPSLKKETLVLTTKPNIIFVTTLMIVTFSEAFEKTWALQVLKSSLNKMDDNLFDIFPFSFIFTRGGLNSHFSIAKKLVEETLENNSIYNLSMKEIVFLWARPRYFINHWEKSHLLHNHKPALKEFFYLPKEVK